MASYMDMVTVLLCLFIVLYAISTVDQAKYEQLSASLAQGFGLEVTDELGDGSAVTPTSDEATLVGSGARASEPFEAALQEVTSLIELREQIDERLVEREVQDAVDFVIDDRGLTIRLVGNETFFGTNQSSLTEVARVVLDAVAEPLVASGYDAAVEGHADIRPPASPYPSNWELSTARSTEVLRYLVASGMPPPLIAAVGYGDARPLSAGTSSADLAQNRRTDIVVFSDWPDAVRDLFPAAVTDIEGDA